MKFQASVIVKSPQWLEFGLAKPKAGRDEGRAKFYPSRQVEMKGRKFYTRSYIGKRVEVLKTGQARYTVK